MQFFLPCELSRGRNMYVLLSAERERILKGRNPKRFATKFDLPELKLFLKIKRSKII